MANLGKYLDILPRYNFTEIDIYFVARVDIKMEAG